MSNVSQAVLKKSVIAYFIIGFSAPVFFWFLPPHDAGKIAGCLFIITAVLAVRLAFRNLNSVYLKMLSLIALFSYVVFYSWRWQLSTPTHTSRQFQDNFLPCT
jgi:multisubunit Na+/H+ antiporter MnhB subunit